MFIYPPAVQADNILYSGILEWISRIWKIKKRPKVPVSISIYSGFENGVAPLVISASFLR